MLFINFLFWLSLVRFSQCYTYDLGSAHVSPGLTAKIYAISRDLPTGNPTSDENNALYRTDSIYIKDETFLTDPNVTYLTTVNGVTDFSISFEDSSNITVYGEKIDATQFIVETRGYFIPPVNGTYYLYNYAYPIFDSDQTYIPEYYATGFKLVGQTYIATDDAGDATCNQLDKYSPARTTYTARLITEGTSANGFNMGSLIAGRAYPITMISLSLQKALNLSIWFKVGDQSVALDGSNFVTMDYDDLDWSDVNAIEYPDNCPVLATTTTYERSVVYSTTTMSTYVTTITGTNGIKTTETVYVVAVPIPGVTPTMSSTSSIVSSESSNNVVSSVTESSDAFSSVVESSTVSSELSTALVSSSMASSDSLSSTIPSSVTDSDITSGADSSPSGSSNSLSSLTESSMHSSDIPYSSTKSVVAHSSVISSSVSDSLSTSKMTSVTSEDSSQSSILSIESSTSVGYTYTNSSSTGAITTTISSNIMESSEIAHTSTTETTKNTSTTVTIPCTLEECQVTSKPSTDYISDTFVITSTVTTICPVSESSSMNFVTSTYVTKITTVVQSTYCPGGCTEAEPKYVHSANTEVSLVQETSNAQGTSHAHGTSSSSYIVELNENGVTKSSFGVVTLLISIMSLFTFI